MTSADELVRVAMGRTGEGLVFAPDGSGWARYTTGSQEFGRPNFEVKIQRATPQAAFTVVQIVVRFRPGQGSQALRDIPVSRIEAAANVPSHRGELEALIPSLDEADPDHAVYADRAADDEIDGHAWWEYEVPRQRSPRLRLKIPETYRKPDEFYRQVADVFAYLSTVSTRPAAELAEANDVEVTSIHGWVKEARRRGFLSSSERAREQS